MSESNIAEYIRAGLEMETQGLEMYELAAANSTHPFAKEMFLSLAGDERRHAEWFKKLGESLGMAGDLLSGPAPEAFLTSIQGIFAGLREEIDGKPADTDDLEVIRTALGLEEKAYQFYSEAAEKADDADTVAILSRMAKEENNHYRILDDVLLYLTDPEKWNIKEENPLIDG